MLINMGKIMPRTGLRCACHNEIVIVGKHNKKFCPITKEECRTIAQEEVEYLIKKTNDRKQQLSNKGNTKANS